MDKTTAEWGKNALFAGVNLILAEFLWRLARVIHEYFYYTKHYPLKNKLRTIVNHGFKFEQSFMCLMAIILAAILTQYPSIPQVLNGIFEQVYLLPIMLIFRFVQITKSAFDYSDFIRSDSGLDYATGMASNYFHGYLNLILPHPECKGIVKQIENYESKHDIEFAVKRLMILIPNSLHTRPIIESPLMERQERQPLEGLIKNRAGVSRPYRNDVYRIVIDEKAYYITVEGATPLLSYFDALNFHLTSTWQMKAMQKEIMIKFYRYLKNILEKWPATQGQCELVFYNDYTAEGRPQDVGEVLCLHIKQIWANKH